MVGGGAERDGKVDTKQECNGGDSGFQSVPHLVAASPGVEKITWSFGNSEKEGSKRRRGRGESPFRA